MFSFPARVIKQVKFHTMALGPRTKQLWPISPEFQIDEKFDPLFEEIERKIHQWIDYIVSKTVIEQLDAELEEAIAKAKNSGLKLLSLSDQVEIIQRVRDEHDRSFDRQYERRATLMQSDLRESAKEFLNSLVFIHSESRRREQARIEMHVLERSWITSSRSGGAIYVSQMYSTEFLIDNDHNMIFAIPENEMNMNIIRGPLASTITDMFDELQREVVGRLEPAVDWYTDRFGKAVLPFYTWKETRMRNPK